jgi:hypothetical protein
MMTVSVRDGRGILSGVHDSDKMERLAEAERALQQAVAEREAAQEDTKHQIEATMVQFLRDEISQELEDQKKSSTGTDKRSRADFLRFRSYCARLDLPHLPASPATVAAFLTSEIHHGKAHMRRCIKAISTTHLRCDLHDPTSDLLVRALLRLAVEPSRTDDKPSKPEEGI